MQRILLASSNPQHRTLLEKALDRENCSIVAVVETATNLTSELRKRAIDMLVLDLENDGAAHLASIRQIMEKHPLPIVLFVQQGDPQSAADATAAGV